MDALDSWNEMENWKGLNEMAARRNKTNNVVTTVATTNVAIERPVTKKRRLISTIAQTGII